MWIGPRHSDDYPVYALGGSCRVTAQINSAAVLQSDRVWIWRVPTSREPFGLASSKSTCAQTSFAKTASKSSCKSNRSGFWLSFFGMQGMWSRGKNYVRNYGPPIHL